MERQQGDFSIELYDRDTGKTQVVPYSLKQRMPEAEDLVGFDPSDVIYLLMPDRFSNGNPDNDTVDGMLEKTVDRSEPYGRHGGDLQGVLDHLDYFEGLGVTALWLNPVLENNMPRASYHGYAITDFYRVDRRFGTLEDYIHLSEQLRARGMKLVMDMVFNHCGSEHWWMKDLPSADWINYSDDFKVTNHLRSTHEDPYASNIDTELMTQGWFVQSMPDLNLRNPLLADYMIQNSIWWIETLGLGGIRMDTYPYPDKYAMSDWCRRVMTEYPNFNITGEEWSLNPNTLAYWQEGNGNPDGYEGALAIVNRFPPSKCHQGSVPGRRSLEWRIHQSLRNAGQRSRLRRSEKLRHFFGKPRYPSLFYGAQLQRSGLPQCTRFFCSRRVEFLRFFTAMKF